MKFIANIPIELGQEGNVPPEFADRLRDLIVAAFYDIIDVDAVTIDEEEG